MSLITKIATSNSQCGAFTSDCPGIEDIYGCDDAYTQVGDSYMSCNNIGADTCVTGIPCDKVFKPVDQEVIQAVGEVADPCGANSDNYDAYQISYYFRFLYSDENSDEKFISIGGKQQEIPDAYKAEKVELPHIASMTCSTKPNAGDDPSCLYDNSQGEFSMLEHLEKDLEYFIEVSVGNSYDADPNTDPNCTLSTGTCDDGLCVKEDWNINNPVYDPARNPTPIGDGTESYRFPIEFVGFCEKYSSKNSLLSGLWKSTVGQGTSTKGNTLPSDKINIDIGDGSKTQTIKIVGYQAPYIDFDDELISTCANVSVNGNGEYVLIDHLGIEMVECGVGQKVGNSDRKYTFPDCTIFFQADKVY